MVTTVEKKKMVRKHIIDESESGRKALRREAFLEKSPTLFDAHGEKSYTILANHGEKPT